MVLAGLVFFLVGFVLWSILDSELPDQAGIPLLLLQGLLPSVLCSLLPGSLLGAQQLKPGFLELITSGRGQDTGHACLAKPQAAVTLTGNP